VGSSCNCTVQAAGGLIISGTGAASDPFVISVDRTRADQDFVVAGPINFSEAGPDAFGVIGLSADASEVVLPSNENGHLQLLIRQDGTGNTVTWPAEVKWPGGVAPVLSTTTGNSDWIDLRRVGDYWVGRLVAAEIG
jgi:hypothetical protein